MLQLKVKRMKEIMCDLAVVRIHGNPNHEYIKESTVEFIRQSERYRDEQKENT